MVMHAHDNVLIIRLQGLHATRARVRVGTDHLQPGARRLLKRWGYPDPETTSGNGKGTFHVKTPAGYACAIAWMSLIASRSGNGNMAWQMLDAYANWFIRPNTFHINGDPRRAGFSLFDYDPMTLEAGFGAAAAVMEMLLQSHGGRIRVFPTAAGTMTRAGDVLAFDTEPGARYLLYPEGQTPTDNCRRPNGFTRTDREKHFYGLKQLPRF